tara:strand:- start:983 stop:1951 length:969 start_codon:yes stop_codon:yes gene_type:complete
MAIKHQHINFFIVVFSLFFIGCDNDKPTTPQQINPEVIYIPGQFYGDSLGHIEYRAGNTPIIITVPHDGTLNPSSIPDRTYGTMIRDINTKKLAERFTAFAVQRSGGLFPHVIISNLDRKKLDPNRDITEGAQGNIGAIQAYNAYHSFIQTAIDTAETYFDSVILLDLHGHAHDIERLELGYLLTTEDLNMQNQSINNSEYIEKSSITQIASLSQFPFSEILRGATSFGTYIENKSYSYEMDEYTFDVVPSVSTISPGTDPYFNGGYTTEKYSTGKVNTIQIEAHYSRARDTARSYGALGSILEEALREFYQEHTLKSIYQF